MKIGIIGPTNVTRFCEQINIDPVTYMAKITDLANLIAEKGHEIIIVPHKDSVSEFFALEYKKADGNNAIGMIPMDDIEHGIDMLDQECCDEIINCVSWRNQPETLAIESDMLISLGFSAGTMTEIYATKYYPKDKKIKVIIIEDFITLNLPIESIIDLNLNYVKLKEVFNRL